VLNAANEQAVAAFLEGKIPFLGIAKLVERALEDHAKSKSFAIAPSCAEAVMSLDCAARATVDEAIVNL